MKKIFLTLFIIILICASVFPAFAEESGEVSDISAPESGEPVIYENCKAVIYNPQTGTFVYDHKGDARAEAATSAKMTALILIYDLFSTNLNSVVTVKAEHLKNTDFERAITLIKTKYAKKLSTKEDRQKTFMALMRRGFLVEDIKKAMKCVETDCFDEEIY